MKSPFLCLGAALIVCWSAPADVIQLNTGQMLNGKAVQTNDEGGMVFQREAGTITYPRGSFRNIILEPGPTTPSESESTPRIPKWSRIITSLAKEQWATELKQIPATVINTGVLRNVPYTSFRCGYNYEVNIYGDPENPACVEIGITGFLLKDSQARSNCIQFIGKILPREADRKLLGSLNMVEDLKKIGDLTFEITPPNGKDSYGGWWLSIYKEEVLDAARADAKELAQITESKSTLSSATAAAEPWSKDELQQASPARGEGRLQWRRESVCAGLLQKGRNIRSELYAQKVMSGECSIDSSLAREVLRRD